MSPVEATVHWLTSTDISTNTERGRDAEAVRAVERSTGDRRASVAQRRARVGKRTREGLIKDSNSRPTRHIDINVETITTRRWTSQQVAFYIYSIQLFTDVETFVL